ncbi:MAG: hypothetical protein J1E56_04150 [Ruminococcus sp.]|nr:hypothetical protein [Ruminococcus sp.]
MKKMKALLLTFIVAAFAVGNIPANAIEIPKDTLIEIEYLENGDYIETVISNETNDNATCPLATTKTITKSKTKYYKNSAGTVLWSVTIKGTFTYDGSTSKCTSCSHSASAPASNWSIKSISSSKSGNSATAKCVATYKGAIISTDYSMSVTITCSANGTIS